MKHIALLLFSFMSLSVHARITAICSVERTDLEKIAKSPDPAQPPADSFSGELLEASLTFESAPADPRRAVAKFNSRFAPNYEIVLTITETFDGKNVDWSSELKTIRRSDGTVVADSVTEHTFNSADNRFKFEIQCDTYDKGADGVEESATDDRARARLNYVGGAWQERSYRPAPDAKEEDRFDNDLLIWDLLQILTKQNSSNAQKLRDTLQEFARRKWDYNPLGHLAVKSALSFSPVSARQSFELDFSYSGQVLDRRAPGGTRFGYIILSVKGDLIRNRDGKIVEYRIHSVTHEILPGTTFGTASTSGGRIKGR